MGGCNSLYIEVPGKKGKQLPIDIDDKDREKYEQGKPVVIEKGLNITKNPETNKLIGIPEQWVTNQLKLPFQVDREKVVQTKNLRQQIRPDQQLPKAILELINTTVSNRKQQIQQDIQSILILQSRIQSRAGQSIRLDAQSIRLNSNSKIMQSKIGKIQIEVDKNKPYGLKQLPEQWATTVAGSFIAGQVNDPIALATIISHYDQALRMTIKQKQLLSTQDFEKRVRKVKFLQGEPQKNFIFHQQLGNGGVCKVFRAEARFSPNTFYAVRIMKQKDVHTLNKIRCEIAVMQLCNSPNIVGYNFTYYYKDSLFMFIEYMDAGSLTSFIKKYEKKIPEKVIAYILKEILTGLASIHQHFQIHRDIKSDNILLGKNGKIKIADFGYALQLTADKVSAQGLAGTAPWMAPELIKKEPYDQMVDIWSLGILGVQLCEGEPPYLRLPPLKAMYKIASEEPPKISGFSQKLQSFVQSCLKKDPNQRWTSKQLLSHSFISQVSTKQKQQFLYMLSRL